MLCELDEKRAEYLGRLVTRISMKIQYEVSQQSGPRIKVTPAQKSLLFNLEQNGNRISEIAERLLVSKQAASKLVQELESSGLVKRRVDKCDARASIITFTAKGRHIVDSTMDCLENLENNIEKRFGKSELKDMKKKLEALADFIDPNGF